jgi:excisionase family DNA binding protein
MTTQPAEVMSRKEAADYLRVGKSTLDRLNIPKIQIRRRILFKKETIDKWLLSQQTKTTTGTKA